MHHQTRLGEMLTLYRVAKGQSLRDFAPSIGVSHSTLQRIETGAAIDAATLLKVWAWLLGKPL